MRRTNQQQLPHTATTTAVSLCSRILLLIIDFHLEYTHNIRQQLLLVQPIVYTGARRLGIRVKEKKHSCWFQNYPVPWKIVTPPLNSQAFALDHWEVIWKSHQFTRNQNHSGLPYRPLDSCWCGSWVWRSWFSEDQSCIRLVQCRPIWS